MTEQERTDLVTTVNDRDSCGWEWLTRFHFKVYSNLCSCIYY